jgi:hypothetical protein
MTGLQKSSSTPAVFQRPVCVEKLYQGRSAIESVLDYRIEDLQYEGAAVGAFAGRDRADLDITERQQECVNQWDVVGDRFARSVSDFVIKQPKDVQAYRDGIIADEQIQAADHERVVAKHKRERMLQKHQREMAQSLAGFIASQQLGLEKPAWTYTDPPGYFERKSSLGSIVDDAPSENFVKNSLMGMWNTAGYRHCHADANVMKPTPPGLDSNAKLSNKEANKLYYEWLKEHDRMGLSGPSEANMAREGWGYFKDFGDDYFGRWKGIDVDVDSKHPRHGFLHSVEQHKLRGPKEKHYDQKTTKKLKIMQKQHNRDMINETTGWRRRERLLREADDFSTLASSDRKKIDWSAQDKNGEYFEYPIYNALSDEPYSGAFKDIISTTKRNMDYSHTDFVCGTIRKGREGPKGYFSDPLAPSGTRTLTGEFWLKPDSHSSANKGNERVQKKFDHWNRSGRQYWTQEALRSERRDGLLRKLRTQEEAPAEEEPQRVFKLSTAPNRLCWAMHVHAGCEQQEIHVEADPRWTVDDLLKRLLSEATKCGLIGPNDTMVAPSVNRADAVWNLLECKSKGQSTAVERTQTLQTVGLQALQNTHLTHVGLAASSVSPLAVSEVSQTGRFDLRREIEMRRATRRGESPVA